MRKLLLLTCMSFFAILGFAQDKAVLESIDEINFYGIDFSKAKVYMASETPQQFVIAFREINDLMQKEPKKYDMEKIFKRNVLITSYEQVNKRNGKIDPNNLTTTNSQFALTEDDINDAILSLELEETTGTGVLVVAELLSKAEKKGFYTVVFFDIESKTMIDSIKVKGTAAGFGLRNYWAASLRKALKSMKL